MRIKRIVINGFGSLHDFDPGELANGLTIFEGRNEAGKSTIMAFIRAILLGFPTGKGKGSKYERYEPFSGGPYGGTLTLVDDQGQEYRIVRNRVTGKSGGQVTVFLPDGTQEGESFLQRLIGGISPVLFKQIFAFSLTELQQMDFLENEEINSYIYSAGMGTGIPVMEVDRKLDGAMNALFKPRASTPLINQHSAKLKELEKEISRLQQQSSQYNQLLAEEQEIEKTMVQGEQESEGLRRKRHELDIMGKGRESWEALWELRFRLNNLPDPGEFPTEGLERLDQILLEKRRLEVLLKQKKEKRTQLQAEMKRIERNLALLREKHALENLLRKVGRVKECQERLSGNRVLIQQYEEAVELQLRQLGGSWQPEDLLAMDISLGQREQVRFFRNGIQEEGNEQLRVESQRERLKKEWQKQKALQASLEKEVSFSSLAQLEKEIPIREAALKEIERIRHTIEGVQREEAHLLERIKDIEERGKERPVKEKSMRQMIFLVFIFGVIVSIIIGFQNFWLGLLTGAFTMFFVFLLIKQNKSERGEAPQVEQGKWISKLRELQLQLDDNRREQDQLHKQLQEQGKKVGLSSFSLSSISRVEEKTREMRREREGILRLKERIKDYRQQLSLLEEEYRSLEEEGKGETKIAQQWQEWLLQRNLESSLSPEGVMDFFRLVERGRDLYSHLCQAREEYKGDQQFISTFSQQVESLFNKATVQGFSLEEPLTSFYLLHKKMEEEEEKFYQWNQWEKELNTLEEELAEVLLTYDSYEQQEKELYGRGGVAEEEEFRRKGGIHRQRAQLQNEIQRRESELLVLTGTEEKKDALETSLQTYDSFTIEEELQKVIEKGNALQHQLNQWRERKGQVREQIIRLEQEGTLSRLLQEKEETLTELKREAKKWGVYAICRHLLKESREKYERERQPGVLREASHYFSKITGGSYARIVAPIGSETLYVEGEKGEQIEPGYLSRGTREQLYLSMRFALAREFSRQVSLPLVMDDILVNFDLGRLRKTVEALREISKYHQILFFTCHPYVSKILLEEIEGSKLIQIGNPIGDYKENVLF